MNHFGRLVIAMGYLLVSRGLAQVNLGRPFTPPPASGAEWHGYSEKIVSVYGFEGYVVIPPKPLPGGLWVWRASFPEYHPEAALSLLKNGFRLAYLDLPDTYGSPTAVAAWDKFYDRLTGDLGLSRRVALEAVSRGGLIAYNWAVQHPERVICVYAESPVCDIKSWPGGRGRNAGSPKDWQQALHAYGFTEEQMLAFRGNPIDHAAELARYKIPILHVVCSEDQILPPAENTEIFAKRYREGGGPIEVYYNKSRPTTDRGHHFTLDDPRKEVQFVVEASAQEGPVR